MTRLWVSHRQWNAKIKAEHGNGSPQGKVVRRSVDIGVEHACRPLNSTDEDLLRYLILISANVGSAVLHGGIIREWQAHVCALQEIR